VRGSGSLQKRGQNGFNNRSSVNGGFKTKREGGEAPRRGILLLNLRRERFRRSRASTSNTIEGRGRREGSKIISSVRRLFWSGIWLDKSRRISLGSKKGIGEEISPQLMRGGVGHDVSFRDRNTNTEGSGLQGKVPSGGSSKINWSLFLREKGETLAWQLDYSTFSSDSLLIGRRLDCRQLQHPRSRFLSERMGEGKSSLKRGTELFLLWGGGSNDWLKHREDTCGGGRGRKICSNSLPALTKKGMSLFLMKKKSELFYWVDG